MSCEVHLNISDCPSDKDTKGQGGHLTCPRPTANVEPDPRSEASQALTSNRSPVHSCPPGRSQAPLTAQACGTDLLAATL